MSRAVFVVSCSTVGAGKIFGTGTKLVVTNTQAKLDPKKIQVLPPSTEQDGKVTYICLIEDFYPNVIKLTWKDDKNNIEKNAINGEIWPSDDNKQSYSVSSWLTIDKLRSKNYKCAYQHESKEASVSIESQDTPEGPTFRTLKDAEGPTTEPCVYNPENRTTLSTDITERLTHRTAYLIYIVLLLKSTMYYVIVLFFMYRMRSPIKRHGKKP